MTRAFPNGVGCVVERVSFAVAALLLVACNAILGLDNLQEDADSGASGNPVSVLSATPATGGTSGGYSVNVLGANFVSGATVTFGGSSCLSVVVRSSSSLSCIAGAHPAGAVSVTVTNPHAAAAATSLTPIFTYTANFGNGTSGSLQVNTPGVIANSTATVLMRSVDAGATTLTVASTNGFTPGGGDALLIIQSQDPASAGQLAWEMAASASATNGSIILSVPTKSAYHASTVAGSSATAQVLLVPQYTDVSVTSSGILTAATWVPPNAQASPYGAGGIVAFYSSGTVIVQDGGVITTNGLGYTGAAVNLAVQPDASIFANQGESWGGIGSGSTEANGGGGGGSTIPSLSVCSTANACGSRGNGGGAGYAGAGTAGPLPSQNVGVPGAGGAPYGVANLALPAIAFGSGGGGATNNFGCNISTGGSGGGIVIIIAQTLIVNGTLSSNGNSSPLTTCASQNSLQAGSGSGGSIYIETTSLTVGSNSVTALAGGTDSSPGRIQFNAPAASTIGQSQPGAFNGAAITP